MSLRKTTLLIILLTFFGLMAMMVLIARGVILESFSSLETRLAEQHLERGRRAIGVELERLGQVVRDWAYWDDAYNYVVDRNANFERVNLESSTFITLDVTSVCYLNRQGEVIWGHGIDHAAESLEDLPEGLLPFLQERLAKLGNAPAEDFELSGILTLEGSVQIFQVRPVLTSDGDGPAHGFLWIARTLDAGLTRKLSRQTVLSLRVIRNDEPMEPMAQEALATLRPLTSGKLIRLVDENTLMGFVLFHDVNGTPSFLLQVRMPREVMNQGWQAMRMSMAGLASAGLVFCLVSLLLMQRKVVGPIRDLLRQTSQIAGLEDLSQRVQISGVGEIKELSLSINRMLEELEQSKERLAEQHERHLENERFLASMFQAVQAGVLLVDPQTRNIVEANPMALSIIGLPREAVLGKRCHGFVCMAEEGKCPVVDLGRQVDLAVRELRTGRGDHLTILKSVTTVERNGRPLLLETFIDITNLEKAQQALRVSEQTYRTVFQNAGAALVLADNLGRIVLANEEFAGLVAMPRSDLEFVRDWVHFIHPEDAVNLPTFGAIKAAGGWDGEDIRMVAANGAVRYVSLALAAIPETERIVVSCLDVTERRAADEELRRAHAELEDKVTERTRALAEANLTLQELDRQKSLFLSSASHELRTPLTSILGFSKLMHKTFVRHYLPLSSGVPVLEDKAKEFIRNFDIIAVEGERLTRLINDLLDLNKIEAGRMVWRDDALDMNVLLERIYRTAEVQFAGKDQVEFRAEIAEGLPRLLADADRIEQVLFNLISNAAKFTDKGRVILRAERAPNEICITVQDTGIGIAPGDLPHVFEKFYQAHTTDMLVGKPLGTGLGLAICRQIVEHYGGTIEVASVLGQGSRFTIRLPARKVVVLDDTGAACSPGKGI